MVQKWSTILWFRHFETLSLSLCFSLSHQEREREKWVNTYLSINEWKENDEQSSSCIWKPIMFSSLLILCLSLSLSLSKIYHEPLNVAPCLSNLKFSLTYSPFVIWSSFSLSPSFEVLSLSFRHLKFFLSVIYFWWPSREVRIFIPRPFSLLNGLGWKQIAVLNSV